MDVSCALTRIGKMFNHKGQKGVFDIGRSKFYRDFVLTNPANDPNIPGTDIPRLRLVYLGGKSVGVDDDDTSRVVRALQNFYASKAAQRANRRASAPIEPPTIIGDGGAEVAARSESAGREVPHHQRRTAARRSAAQRFTLKSFSIRGLGRADLIDHQPTNEADEPATTNRTRVPHRPPPRKAHKEISHMRDFSPPRKIDHSRDASSSTSSTPDEVLL